MAGEVRRFTHRSATGHTLWIALGELEAGGVGWIVEAEKDGNRVVVGDGRTKDAADAECQARALCDEIDAVERIVVNALDDFRDTKLTPATADQIKARLISVEKILPELLDIDTD